MNESKITPARFLVENIDLLPRGRALDVAMGSGRNAVFLAKMGFSVEGVDINPEAIKESLELARREGVTIQTKVTDLETMPDFEEEAYDLVICFNYLQRSLIPQIKKWIKLSGYLVYETFIIDQVKFGKPHNPDFLLKHNELLQAFREFRVLRYREGIVDGEKAIASILAQKVPPMSMTIDRN
jgi:tellurite methyltransferase